MIAILVALAALPIGYFSRTRTAALPAFALAFAHVFTFQTAQLVLEATRGSQDAFGDVRGAEWNWFGDTVGYLVTTLARTSAYALLRPATAVVGAGPVGLVCALALAQRGERVLLFDRDAGPPTDGRSKRTGVMQFHHPHFFRPFVRQVLQK